MVLIKLQLTKLLLTIAPFIIPTALATILPNLTYPTPTPIIACHQPQRTRPIRYNDCREVLEMFRSKHENWPIYVLSHTRDQPEETQVIICPYKLRLGSCTLWLDYKEQWPQNPLVEIAFVVRFGNRLARGCVRDSAGAGGTVVPLDAAGLGSAVLRLEYS